MGEYSLKNAFVAQSGGPSPVINASLCGVIEACEDYPDRIGKIYAGFNGIEGALLEELIDIGAQPREEIALLKNTPASGVVGTCRYKLGNGQEDDFARIIDVFRAHDIGYFFSIGGNDSMDTADKMSSLARRSGLELTVAGVPKTIDNDLGDEEFTIIDHTPGYASCARYWAYLMQNADEENRAMYTSECVSAYQAMGRKSGYITAAARLGDPERRMPLQLYFAESCHNLETLAENVNRELSRSGRCVVVVNEGFDVGEISEKKDGFGHIEYGASGHTAAQAVVNYLNSVKLAARGQATGQVPGVIQRGVSVFASTVDIDEAYLVGRHAVYTAMRDGTGYMATILRKKGVPYEAYYDKVDLKTVANSVRYLPESWISPGGIDVTDAFLDYASPLIGKGFPDIKIENGLQRFAHFDIRFIEKKLPAYLPARMRGGI